MEEYSADGFKQVRVTMTSSPTEQTEVLNMPRGTGIQIRGHLRLWTLQRLPATKYETDAQGKRGEVGGVNHDQT